jgi:hypothetical protein
MTLSITPIDVVAVPDDQVVGIYTVGGKPSKMPARARRLHASAYSAYATIQPKLVISDMFRTPESSLNAVVTGRGALMPSYSSHGYGLAIDVDVTKSMKLVGVRKKSAFDDFMRAAGWHCHRRDGERAAEEWHYDYDLNGLLTSNLTPQAKFTQQAREKMLAAVYGDAWKLTKSTAQGCLAKLGFYHGAIDGAIGPQSKQAIAAFQRAWKLKADETLTPQTLRVLWFVTACADLPPVTA